ncbi:granzyme B-like [Menidia menidia]
MTGACCIAYVLLLVPFTGATEDGIIGGRVAKAHSRPYMASLQFGNHHSCGGILVREDYVLTAAHCKQPQTMTVLLGAHNNKETEKSQQRILVAKYHQHPRFTGKYDYDIMLLKLEKNATLNRFVKPIGLPKKNGKIPANINCVVAGWGRTGDKENPSAVLREAPVKMQFSQECKYLWGEYFNQDHMICTKANKNKGGICQGDSGGPLICNSKPQGITAFTAADNCENPKYPHVFIKIGFFMPWIKKVMLE